MRRMLALLAVAGLALSGAACTTSSNDPRLTPVEQHSLDVSPIPTLITPSNAPLRDGERFITLKMNKPYKPMPPNGGTDDYRCFLLDPQLTAPVYLTGTQFVPQNAALLHHAIFFQIPPDLADKAEAMDAASGGTGWTCFGGDGVNEDQARTRTDAPWLGAWAPGGREAVYPTGLGRPLAPGTRVVMQIHYNLLNLQMGESLEDRSAMQMRVAAAGTPITPLATQLIVAPVELPCLPKDKDAPLCNRDNSVLDVMHRFGDRNGTTIAGLRLICPGIVPGPTQSCVHTVPSDSTLYAVAGHMHLLGRSVSVEVNPGTVRSQVVYDNKAYNFDDQHSEWLPKPAVLKAGDKVKITCTHDVSLRDKLPSMQKLPPRYVVWGEGTSDEMCLGVLTVARKAAPAAG